MKKVVRSIVAVALLFAMAKSLAQEPTVSVSSGDEKSLILDMDASSEPTVVSISDTQGVLMFTETPSGIKGYSKKFDLRNLPKGAYFLTIENLSKETVFEFNIDNSKAVLAESKENRKPIFKQDGERVLLNLLNTAEEAVEITIYDSENRTVFNEEFTDVVVEKAFNFENAYADNYTVVLKTKQKKYSENILIE